MSTYIKASNVSKHYQSHHALDNVSFEIKSGQILGFLGHNGAGKSTLIKALLGAHAYDGKLDIFGLEPVQDRAQIMQHLAYISDVAVLPGWMKVSQLLRYTSGVHPSFNLARAKEFLSNTNIKTNAKISALSKGMKVQLHLALVMATDTKVLILDEPTLGLDLMYRENFYRHLVEWFHDGERALIIASHEVSEIEHLLTDVLIMRQGKAVLQASIEETQQHYWLVDVHQSQISEAQHLSPIWQKKGVGSTQLLVKGEDREQFQAYGEVNPARLADIFIATQQEAA
ncbi:ABC transporter ATP-binding protein [Vibrio sp. Of7-15]|uniref:ABC transporter ATP-binding protein n=1 Tax=Vibrio sp. Of7-15 TaxID=2724879 RepID=UPI001EF3243F|nr:ABC transporter ATP-binding protein [Vibrio sp. Of7-15]